ncbi:MAG: hypothetical protein PHX64_03800 [Candidatus Omnitrophica bacterium]|nr:hypothetical protein [Candidatus Omnitrophota bacterium]MDD5310858.1 hypothetical protein [Candidatus Omnitrophota bacterium]
MRASQTILAAALVLIIASSSAFTGYYIGKGQARERGFERFHKLREYGERHPEQFKKMMDHRRGQIRERLAELKKKDPEKYKAMVQGQIERMESTISELKKDLADTGK